MVLEKVQIVYCDACGMPPEYCEYGPDFESHCNPWLIKKHPALYKQLRGIAVAVDKPERPAAPWTTEQRLTAFYEQYVPEKIDSVPGLLEKYEGKEEKLFEALVKKYGEEPEDPYDAFEDDDLDDLGEETPSGVEGKKRRGVGAKKTVLKDTRVVIQKITRNKKKATTVVVGMDTVPDIKLKDVSKAFSKRFAGSSSVKDSAVGKEIIVQGDHMEAAANLIASQFNVSPDNIYLDINGEFVPFSKF
jgi:density-regulated protein